MRLQLLSDLHLERHPDFAAQPAAGAEVLVLAGDIGSYQAGSLLQDDDFGLERFSPRRAGSAWRHVLYLPGNHEYDGLDFDTTHARLRGICERLGITWIEREAVILDGVRFIGTTLWSDFDALGPGPHEAESGRGGADPSRLTRQLRQREKAFRAADFYLRKYTALCDGEPMMAAALREHALVCQKWLRDALRTPFDGTTVVVTHFAPSLRSADPRYGLTPGTAGFCNALDELLPFAHLWLHGHLHCASDYLAQGVEAGRPWRCRVVANPLGYASKGEQAAFDPRLVIDVPESGTSLRACGR
ncbi:MAG: metallophosphoesterase [Burkholderiaceae bacterium]